MNGAGGGLQRRSGRCSGDNSWFRRGQAAVESAPTTTKLRTLCRLAAPGYLLRTAAVQHGGAFAPPRHVCVDATAGTRTPSRPRWWGWRARTTRSSSTPQPGAGLELSVQLQASLAYRARHLPITREAQPAALPRQLRESLQREAEMAEQLQRGVGASVRRPPVSGCREGHGPHATARRTDHAPR